MLTPVESFWLRWYADLDHSPARLVQQARMILLADSGTRPDTIAGTMGVSEAHVLRVLDQFERERLSAFPRPALFLDEFLSAVHVDRTHAEYVASVSGTLFDLTHPLHRLPANSRRILETAARLVTIGLEVDEQRSHTAGRDLLQGLNLVGYTEPEQHMLACLIWFQRKKIRPEREALFRALSPTRQRQTLALAALLRIAEGMNASRTQSTLLESIVITPETVTLRLSGPQAESDAESIRKRADVWEQVFHLPLQTATPPHENLQQWAEIPVGAETPLTEVARRALSLCMLRWQASEAEVLLGEIAAVKRIRGAARRARLALEIFSDHFKKKPVKRLRRQLRKMEAVLGKVRDLDILLADVYAYQSESAKDASEADFVLLIERWTQQRTSALAHAQAWLGGPDATKLQNSLLDFMANPPQRSDQTLGQSVRQIFQTMMTEIKTRQDAATPEDLKSYHRLRLALKKCRFALEFIQPALDTSADAVLADLIRMQDRLGALNDNQMVQKYLKRFLDAWAERQAKQKAPQRFGAEDVLAYFRARREQAEEQLQNLKPDWSPVRAARLRPRINALLRELKMATWI